MFIETQDTPNPNTIKFLPGQPVMESGVYEFTTIDQTTISPLAAQIFSLGEIKRVFFGANFISVTKEESGDWGILKARIMAAIMDHTMTGLPLFQDGFDPTASNDDNNHGGDDDDNELVQQIKELIETRVRPAVAQDGGDIVFSRFDQGVVYVHMRGACAGCPSSTLTLKSGIENMLRHYVPEVLEVRQIDDY